MNEWQPTTSARDSTLALFHIVVYLDSSPATRRATHYLAPLARTAQVRFTLVTVETDDRRADALFTEAETDLGAPEPLVRRVRASTPERALALETRAIKPDMVVLGPPSQLGWARWLRSSQVGMVARRLTTSVLLIHGRPNELRRALISTAGSEQLANDATVTGRLLGPLNGQATIVHVAEQTGTSAGAYNRDVSLYLGMQPEVATRLEAGRVRLQTAGVKARVRVRSGNVVEEILAELQTGTYDLVVLGARQSHTPLERLLSEALSAELLLRSPVPVLVVQGTTKG